MTVRNPKTVRPFWFLEGVPVLGAVGDIRFNYVPQSVNLSQSLSRSYSKSRDRSQSLRPDTLSAIQILADNPLRDTHSFRHGRNFGLQYNPFKFLNLSIDTNTNQTLNELGATLVPKVVDVEAGLIHDDVTLEDALRDGLVDSSQVGISAFQQEDLELEPGSKVIGRLIKGADGIRTENNSQRFSTTLRPNLGKTKALNWITLQDVVYSVQYNWVNSPASRNTGANLSNSVTIRTGITFRPQDFWRKFGFYKNLEAAEDRYRQQRDVQRNSRQEARRKAREAKEERKALEERLKEQLEQQADSTVSADTLTVEDVQLPDETEIEAPSMLRLPRISPVSIARRFALALTGIRDFSVTYSGSRSGQSNNIGRASGPDSSRVVSSPYSLYSSLFADGPPLGYRFGFRRRITGNDNRIIDPNLQVQDVLTDNDRVTARTTLNPSQSLTISLNWSADVASSASETFRVDEFGVRDTTRTRSGQNSASVWSFGSSYLAMFQSQYLTYLSDRGQSSDQIVGDGDGDGKVILTNKSLSADFRQAFSTGFGTIDSNNLLPLPLPGWTLNYTGLGRLPGIRNLVQSASLRHVYSADYRADYRSNSLALVDGAANAEFDITSGRTIQYRIPETEATSVRVTRRYNPLIGVDVTWKGRVQTKVAWNRNATFSLSTSNADVSENTTEEFTFSASFQKTGMKIPFSRGKILNNRASFNISASRSTTLDRRYRLRDALARKVLSFDDQNFEFRDQEAISGDLVSVINSHTRFTISPQIGYQFSDRVTANFALKYENFKGDSRQPSSQNINGAFNIRLNIAN